MPQFGLVVLVLMILDAANLHAAKPAERKPGQVRESLSYIRQDRILRLTVIAMFVVFIAAYNLQVMMLLVASRMLGGSFLIIAAVCATTAAVTAGVWLKYEHPKSCKRANAIQRQA